MLARNSSIRSSTVIFETSSGVRSASSMPAWWIAESFCCCKTSVGHLANGDDQVLGRPLRIDHRRRVNAHVAVLKTAQRRAARTAGCDCSVERAEIGAENLGRAHHLVEVGADDVFAAGPLAQAAIAPENRVVAIQQDDAIGHALQDALVLNEPRGVDHFGKMIGIGIDADVVAGAELRESPNRGGIDDLDIVAKSLA